MTPTSDPTPSSSHDQAPAWVAELIKTMQPISDLAAMHALGKRRDNNWRAMVRLFTATIVLVMVGVWVLFQSRAWGLQSDPLQRSVAIIPVEGPIAPGLNASAERLVGLIERACKADSVESLLLQINSPGGSPSEAERVMAAVQTCRAKTDSHEPKRVVAMIDGLGASAAYMIAMSTDEIVAGRYSIVGSIGGDLPLHGLLRVGQALRGDRAHLSLEHPQGWPECVVGGHPRGRAGQHRDRH
jgi:protease-4